jgi:hypothetical protein
MRSLSAVLGSAVLRLSLVGLSLAGLSLAGAACSKQAKPAAPAPAAEAPPPAPVAETPPPQGIAVGEPNPADPAPARPPSITDADLALADKMIVVIGKLADGVVKAGSDCQAVAAHIRAMAPEMKALSDESKKMEAKLSAEPSAKDWFEKTYGPKVAGRIGGMMNSPCINDPAVSQAIQSLNF